MGSALTTHVLDTAAGRPAAGVRIELWRLEPAPALVAATVTNADGRTGAPLLPAGDFLPGIHELRFFIGDYFELPAPRFLDVVPVRVTLAEGQGHYHVPLLCSPWAYSTYRGS
ncbi:hydroxyisourate hydrolase [Roseomonas hellenica]|uniref:5-hydroxyisourate hydrolase n=1 Tax=Plastoroseomonas hellenica TaxID=2687306 RepID=A0ABS5F283_9PROT|nr:hydroxyisourate hydrolase [Plastoroseomonas hellenica]MBR0666631.1 hydroxyisourate hydrolase [Plastoroseomonas hellenica]